MSDTLKPPAPSKWAMEAAIDIADIDGICIAACPGDSDLTAKAVNPAQIAAIIQRHHAATQAETVALLEECAEKIPPTIKLMNNEIAVMRYENLILRLNKHLAQLKEGAP